MNIQLVLPELSHAAALAAEKNDPLVTRYLGRCMLPYTESRALQDLLVFRSEEGKKRLSRVILVEGRPAGMVYGYLPENGQQSAELGYWLGCVYWGQGIMTRAAGELCALLFAREEVHRIWASALKVNIGSWRVMEKLGMRREGDFREAICIDGRYYDDLYYGMLRREFTGGK